MTSAVGERGLLLEHDARGGWRRDGAAAPELDGALDCDLGLSPLTNLMPVRRHALHEGAGPAQHRSEAAAVQVAARKMSRLAWR